jgi:hypothetical protein
MLSTERDREPDDVVSSAHVMLFHLLGAAANGATQLSGRSSSSKLNGLRGLISGELQIAPVGHC